MGLYAMSREKKLMHMEITIVFDRHGLEILFWFKIIFYF